MDSVFSFWLVVTGGYEYSFAYLCISVRYMVSSNFCRWLVISRCGLNVQICISLAINGMKYHFSVLFFFLFWSFGYSLSEVPGQLRLLFIFLWGCQSFFNWLEEFFIYSVYKFFVCLFLSKCVVNNFFHFEACFLMLWSSLSIFFFMFFFWSYIRNLAYRKVIKLSSYVIF